MKKSIQAVVLSIVVFAVVLTGLSVMAHRKGTIKDDESESILPFDNTSKTNEYTISENITGIDIDWQSGDISIEPYEKDTVTIIETGKDPLNGKQYLEYSINDGKLVISYNKSTMTALLKSLTNIQCEVYVPETMFEGLKADITVKSLNSDIDVSGFKLNDLNLETLSGNIEIVGMDAASGTLKSVSGNINIDDSVIQVLECNTTSGSVKTYTVSKDLIINSVSGSLDIHCIEIFERADVKNVSGSIEMSLPENKGMTINLSKLSGSFNCDFEVSQDDETYTYKNGQIPLNIKTTSGSVRIKKDED